MSMCREYSDCFACICRLSLCDLAGSERYTKSQTSGERLKEAGNINTSLLTLGRCIETLRYNQQHKSVPFFVSSLLVNNNQGPIVQN